MRKFVLTASFFFLTWAGAQAVTLSSPGGALTADVGIDAAGSLVFSVARAGKTVIAPSRIGITIAGVDLGAGAALGEPVFGKIDESYPVFGGKRTALDRARTLALPIMHRASGRRLTLEARAYDDGFAWRLIVPGEGAQRVDGEASGWTLPAASKVWFYERNSDWKLKSYAGECTSADIDRLPTISSQGPVQCPPLVAELPAGRGFVAITEAALANYSGLRLRAIGHRTLQADFTEGANGFVVNGTVTTPWRVTLVAINLDALVNSDLITNLSPPPDPELFADTRWIKPGRAVWRWWSRGTGSPAEERQFVDYAAELGFEYTLVDDGWKAWPDAWRQLAALCAYARERHVGVLIWKDYKDLSAPAKNWAQLRAFLDTARTAGVVGVKIDFLNAESKDRVDFITTALRLAAERLLMVDFHGVGKPTGEARTWPNAITREGIRGLELNKMAEGPISATHNAALPFTRFVAGPGDYTPLGYSRPGATTWAHQLATVVQFTSPLQVIAENPETLLHDPATQPALAVLKSIPTTWDETRVLAPSRIGELSVFARRSGSRWFLAVLNGANATAIPSLDLSFLGAGTYSAVELTSPKPAAFERRALSGVTAGTAMGFALKAGDGAVVEFTPTATTAKTPQISPIDLRGEWAFALDPLDRGESLGWAAPAKDWDGLKPYPRGGWDAVEVPHDFLSDPRYAYTGVAWYRRSFRAPADAADGRVWRLQFDTVFQRCRVWLNGRFVGAHEGGYTPFEFSVASQLEPGRENLLVVAVDNRVRLRALPGARSGATPGDGQFPWLNYGGILGGVRLVGHAPVWIARQKIETHFRGDGAAEIAIDAMVRNGSAQPRRAVVTAQLADEDDHPLPAARWSRPVELAAGATQSVELRGVLPASAFVRWDLETPQLYRSRVTLTEAADGTQLHEDVVDFGFRSLEMREGKFLLNGRPVHLAGANRARGNPKSGGIDTDEVVARDLEMMKTAGLRFARLQHTPPGRNVLEWADRHGMLLILEAGAWGYPAADLASEELRGRFRTEMREMMEMVWNHPSVVGWSLGNEYESWTPAGVAWTRDMAAFVKQLDPTRPVTFAAVGKALRELRAEPTGAVREHAFDYVDFISTNLYFPPPQVAEFLDPVHARWPDKPVFVSEFGLRADLAPTEQDRLDYFDAMLALAHERPWVCGLSWWSFNDYASRYPGTGADGYRRWGLVDEFRKPRPLYTHVVERLHQGL